MLSTADIFGQPSRRVENEREKVMVYGREEANSWAAFRALPLTEAEFQVIASNIAPYLR